MKVGILGGGQLAKMLAQAGLPLGVEFSFLDPAADACAFPLGQAHCGSYDDLAILRKFSDQADVITYEFENVPARTVQHLAKSVHVYPSADSLTLKQDRLREKNIFNELEIPAASSCVVDSFNDLRQAADRLGMPLVLKTRSLGYDGKGIMILNSTEDLETAWEGMKSVSWMAEKNISFEREVSMVAVRGKNGEQAFYPLVENQHHNGILQLSRCSQNDPMEALAREYARRLLVRLGHIGVLTLELFQFENKLLANEFAPRVHNSGHWTIEGAQTSQFENHLRAILGLPLGSCQVKNEVAMVNCIGRLPDPELLNTIPETYLHVYGKALRPGRKVGHVTICAQDAPSLKTKIQAVQKLMKIESALPST